MAWGIEVTDQFEAWWDGLTADEQAAVAHDVLVLEQIGPALRRPYGDTV